MLKENQQGYKFKLGPETTSATGKKYKKLFLFGDTRTLNQQIKGNAATVSGEVQKILGKYSGVGKLGDDFVVFMMVWKDRVTGEYDIQKAKREFQPYIDKLNQHYKYTVSIDELLNQLENYVPPVKSPSDPKDSKEPKGPTTEEAFDMRKKVEEFKEKILSISSSDDLQNLIRLMTDVKGANNIRLSSNNRMLIKAQKPDATLVAAKGQWRDWYNRTVRPNAKPLWISKGVSNDSNDNNIERDFLGKVGKSNYNDLTGTQKDTLYGLQTRAKYNQVVRFEWTAYYDVSDTVQIEGTYDEISANREKELRAKAELGDRTIGDIDTDTQTTTDETVIKPIYNGLMAYGQAQNMTLNVDRNNASATGTKLLASTILNDILSGKMKGFASKAAREASSPAARRQQAEIASWQFMEAFGVNYNLADIDIDTVFGARVGSDYEKSRKDQRKRINDVLNDISDAVNHLVDFVNVNIKDNAGLSEMEGGLPQGKHVTPSQIARELGIGDMVNELQSLQERLLKKVLKNIL